MLKSSPTLLRVGSDGGPLHFKLERVVHHKGARPRADRVCERERALRRKKVRLSGTRQRVTRSRTAARLVV